jgi:hypothetical protein
MPGGLAEQLDGRLAELERRFEDDVQARRDESSALIAQVQQVTPLASGLAQTRSDVATIGDDLDQIVARLTAVESALEDKKASPKPGTPIVWHQLKSEQAALLWPEFTAWVVWLADTYALGVHQLPRCWYQHGGIVQELTDLWTSFASAHDRDKGDTASAVYLWQDALGRALERFAGKWFGNCVNGTHQPRARDSWDDHAYRRQFAEPPLRPGPAAAPTPHPPGGSPS